MPPLTSPPGCASCLCLSQKVTELERRISILYRINEDEKFLDFLVSMGPAHSIVALVELDSSVPCSEPARFQAGDPWSELGARPKVLVSSTPQQMEHWTNVRKSRHSKKSPCSILSSWDVELVNRFNALDDQEFLPLWRGLHFPSSMDTIGH